MIDALAARAFPNVPRLAGDIERVAQLIEGPDRDNTVSRVDSILNLSSGFGDLGNLSRESLAETFSILAELYDRGIVGYEVREVNGEPMKVFTDVAIGSDLHRAPLYRDGQLDTYA